METQSLVTIVPWQFIATIINLFIQVWLLKKFLFKPINNILEKRRQLADQEISDAQKAQTEANSLKEQYEASIADAQTRATEIVQSAQKEAQARADGILQKAQDEASSMKSKAEADIAQEKKKALNDVKDEIGGLAMDIAGKVVEKEINEEDHRKLIDEFIQNVGDAS